MKAVLFIILSLFLSQCSKVSITSDDLIRLVALSQTKQTTTKLSLSIKGQLKDKDGKPLANTLLSQNAAGISSSYKRQVTTPGVRCVDYNLNNENIQCMYYLKTQNLPKTGTCYSIYYGNSNNNKLSFIARFRVAKNTPEIKFLHKHKLLKDSEKYYIFLCSDSNNLVSEEYTADANLKDTQAGTITDKEGNYELNLPIGQKFNISIQNPSQDLGSMIIDLSNIDSKEKAIEVSEEPSKLSISKPDTIQTTVSVSTKEETISTDQSTSTSTNTTVELDPSVLVAIDADTSKSTAPTIALPSVAYSSSSYTFIKDAVLPTITPAITGPITSCVSSPTLPAGLSIDNTTCAISGIPTVTQAATSYTITTSNSSGSSTTTISISVNLDPPSNLVYSGNPFTFTKDIAISTITPTASGVITGCVSSPVLPAGLSIDNATCAISGTPTTVQVATSYTITASNVYGSTTTSISITINANPPSNLVYSSSLYTFTKNIPITTITPTFSGAITSCTASLPANLSIDNTTCAISGTPTTVQVATSYTITASNSYGSTTANISITVNNSYTIGGSITGLNASGLVLQNNLGESLTISSGATSYTFSTPVAAGGSYSVVVTSQPTYLNCTVTGGAGTNLTANISNANVSCSVPNYTLSINVTGITGTGMSVISGTGQTLASISANGALNFSTPIAAGTAYNVSVSIQPTTSYCIPSSPSGTISAATTVTINCYNVPALYTGKTKWNDYIKNDGSTWFNATNVACAGTEGGGYGVCIHAGQMKQFTATGYSSCTNITAEDSLGAFNWTCDSSTNPVRVVSTSLKDNKRLADLIDLANGNWKLMTVTVSSSGTPVLTSPSFVAANNKLQLITSAGGTLGAVSTILYINSNVTLTAQVNFAQSNMGIVTGDYYLSSTASTRTMVISGFSFIWVEGNYKYEGSNTTDCLDFWGMKFSVIRNFKFQDLNTARTGGYMRFFGIKNSYLKNVSVTGPGVSPIFYNNTFDMDGFLAEDLFFQNIPYISIEYNLGSSSLLSQNNSILGLTATGSPVNSTTNALYVSNGTFTNSTGNGLVIYAVYYSTSSSIVSSYYDTLANIASVNNANYGIGGSASGSMTANYVSANTFYNLALGHNSSGPVSLNYITDNHFSGKFLISTGSGNCWMNGSATTGFGISHNSACAPEGTSPGNPNGTSSFTATSQTSLANSFVGKVTTDDAVNPSDTNGAGTYSASLDLVNFENPYRGWGKDGSAFPNADNRGRCDSTNTSCRIYDWSLKITDTILRNANTCPTGNGTLKHRAYGTAADQAGCTALMRGSVFIGANNCQVTWLKHAVEITGDAIGNDNGFCESGENCLYTPNIASYQGHGNIVPASTVTASTTTCSDIGTGGTIQNVKLFKYETNGR